MTDNRLEPAASDDELLSAYLADELDAGAAARLEQRLARDPQLAARLDALADALVALGGFDAVETPHGYEERLSRRLSSADAPADLAAHRRRRSAQWLRIGAVAAVVAAGALMAGGMLRGLGGGGATDTAAESAAVEGGATEAAEADLRFQAGGESRPSAPVILDEQVAVSDEDALRRRYRSVPEVQGLLGVPRDEARALARRFTNAISSRDVITAPLVESGPVSSSGAAAGGDADAGGTAEDSAESPAEEGVEAARAPAAPAGDEQQAKRRNRRDPCLSAITADARGPIVPVRVETLRYDGRPAIAYVFVTSSPGSQELDRTEVWVVQPGDCTTIVFQQY